MRCRGHPTVDAGPPAVLAHLANEAEPLAWQRLDQPLFVAGVADRAAGRIDAIEQRGLRHDAPMPNRWPADHPC